MWGGASPPPEENAYLPDFTHESVHLLLQGFYGDYPYHNDGLHLDRGVMYDAIWQRCWCQLAAQSASWYATPYGAVGPVRSRHRSPGVWTSGREVSIQDR